jgi:hypothetical protein
LPKDGKINTFIIRLPDEFPARVSGAGHTSDYCSKKIKQS